MPWSDCPPWPSLQLHQLRVMIVKPFDIYRRWVLKTAMLIRKVKASGSTWRAPMIRYLASSLAFLVATLCVTAATAGTYYLCLGEYWLDGRHFGAICPAPGGNQLYGYCSPPGANPNAIAAGVCRQEGSTGTPTVVTTRTHGGNKCGYGFYVIYCQ